MLYALLTPASAQAPPPLSPDARFALALFCAPTCSDQVIDTLDNGLVSLKARDGFPDEARRPLRIMGMAGAEFGIPDAAFVALYGTGVDRPGELAASEQVLLVWVAAPRTEAVETLAIVHRAFTDAARLARGWVEDLDTQKVYGAEAWAALDPRGPITDWFVVDTDPMTETSTRLRLVTRGLRRYGDFELVVEEVQPNAAGDVSFVVNAIATRLRSEPDVPIVLPLNTPEARGSASFRPVARRETDPDDPLLRVTFEGEITIPVSTPRALPPGPPVAVAQVEPATPPPPAPARASDVRPEPPEPEQPRGLVETQEAALRRFAEVVVPAWLRGLPPGEAVAVKVPFNTPAGDEEYMWVELRGIEGTELRGTLMNDPYDVEGLRKGDNVTLHLDEIFDYVWKKADGSREGNTTAPFLKKVVPG